MDYITLNAWIRRSPFTRWLSDLQAWTEYVRWKIVSQKNKTSVPSIQKRKALFHASRSCGLQTLVETGTFLGDTAHFFALRGCKVITVEVEPRLAALARKRFKAVSNVKVLEGDSAVVIEQILGNLRQPALFWLDGHFSGGPTGKGACETPIVAEVRAILANAPAGSIVIADDARCFGTQPDYPTLPVFMAMLQTAGVLDAVVVDDSIRFTVPARGRPPDELNVS